MRLGHRQALGLDVRRVDRPRAGHLEHADAHQSDRAATGHDRGLPGDVLDEGSEDGVAERLLEGGDLGREAFRHPGVDLRHGRRTGQTSRARGRPGCACAGRRGRGRCGTGSTSSRPSASRPRPAADGDARRARAAADDDARHLVAEGHGRWTEVLLRPRVPALDVDVSAAHAGGLTRTSTSPGPGAGMGTSRICRTGRRRFLDQGAHGRANRRWLENGRRLGSHARVLGHFVRRLSRAIVRARTCPSIVGRRCSAVVEIEFVDQDARPQASTANCVFIESKRATRTSLSHAWIEPRWAPGRRTPAAGLSSSWLMQSPWPITPLGQRYSAPPSRAPGCAPSRRGPAPRWPGTRRPRIGPRLAGCSGCPTWAGRNRS